MGAVSVFEYCTDCNRESQLEETPPLRAVVDAYEGDYHSRVIVSPERMEEVGQIREIREDESQ